MGNARRREGWLLCRVGLLLALLYAGLAGNRVLRGLPPAPTNELAALGLYLCGLLGVHLFLVLLPLYGDEGVVPLVGLLTGLGLLLKLRLAAEPGGVAFRSLAVYPGAMLCLVLTVGFYRRRLDWLENTSWLAGFAALGVLLLVIRFGGHYRGGTFGPGRTTPTELLKPLLVVFLAGFLKQRRGCFELLLFAALWLAMLALVVKKGDLGMAAILIALLLSLWFVATGQMRFLTVGLVAAAAVVLVFYYSAPLPGPAAHGQRRVDLWLNPWHSPMGGGYQIVQGLFALRAGGLDGAGFGAGLTNLTPLVTSDFIWAALGEDLGLLGCALVLIGYLALCRRGYRIAALAQHPFSQRLAVGCVTVLAIQTLVNVGGVVRLMPVTGIPLPFISHGGSSLLVCWVLIGLVLAVGHDVETGERGWADEEEEEYARKDSNLRPAD